MIPNWLKLAKAEIGVYEWDGPDDNPQVVEYLHATDLDERDANNDETPWCSAFVNWVMQRAGFKGTRSAMARSWEDWGKEELRVGAIAVFKRLGGGHVGFVTDWNSGSIKILGGNQSDAVNEKWFPRSNLLTTRWPKYTKVVFVDA